jgi:hypothetical protein
MPLANSDQTHHHAFLPTDLLYGFDTEVLKYRTFFRKQYYRGDTDVQHKIDFYTQTMGPADGAPLPATWAQPRPNDTPEKGEFRQFLRAGTANVHFQGGTRYNPERAAQGNEWNARIRRTSKAGLQWGLLVKGWNIHFMLNDIVFADVVKKMTRGPNDQALPDGTHGGNLNKRRITHCELRWIYRHRDFPEVQQRVQFWYYRLPRSGQFQGTFEQVVAPWIEDPKVWARYKPKCEHILDDYLLVGRPRGGTQFQVPQNRSQAEHLQLAAQRARQLESEDPDDDSDWI